MAQKTEKATPKKLRDARKKGQVAKIHDLPSAFTFATSIAATLAVGGYLFQQLLSFLVLSLRAARTPSEELESKMAPYLHLAMQTIINCSLPITVVVCFVGVVVGFLVVGPVFSFEAMKFDFKKLNPVEGIKQKFKIRVLVELLKSIAKITGAAIIIYLLIKSMIPQVVMTVLLPVVGSATVAQEFLMSATIRVGIFFLIVALFDLAFQKKNFSKEMMMEKFEVKQEYRDTEGDPMIKGHRRQLFREIAYQEGPRAARRARAIITNPTHIAVALKYTPEEDPAPTILTMGVGIIADQIIKVGLENKIPIMRNVELARELYAKGKISEYIPQETFAAVAEILKWIKSLEENPDVNIELLRPEG